MSDQKPLEADTVRAQDSPSQGVWRTKQHARTGTRRRAQQKLAKLAKLAEVPSKNRLLAEKLQDAMTRADLSASDVARKIWGNTKDSRGVLAAKNRDRISQYLKGASFPEPETLQKIADAVGVPVEEWTGNSGPTPGNPGPTPDDQQVPSANSDELILTALPAKPGRTRLRVNRELSWKLATHIHNLIRQAEDAELRGALGENPEINPDNGKVVGGTDFENNGTK